MAATSQFCTFHVGGLFLGVEVVRVQEVIRYQEMTRVPLASPVITGLINLRGQIITAIDLRRRLELPARAPGQIPMNVVIRTEDGALSLLVDEIGEVIDVDQGAYESPPDTLTGVARKLVRAVYKLENQLLLIIDTEQTVDVGGLPLSPPSQAQA